MSARFREAVYVGQVDGDFRPQRPWQMPERFTELRQFAKNLTMAQAAYFVGVFNQGQLEALEAGKPIREWAIYSKFIKPKRVRSECREQILAGAPKFERVSAFLVCVTDGKDVTPSAPFLEYDEAEQFRDNARAMFPESDPFIVRMNRRVVIRERAMKGGV